MDFGFSATRAASIIMFLSILSWQTYFAIFNYLDSPVGSKESLLKSEHTDYRVTNVVGDTVFVDFSMRIASLALPGGDFIY